MENEMNYDLDKAFEVLYHYLQKIVIEHSVDDIKDIRVISDDGDCAIELESALAKILESIKDTKC